MRTPSGDREVSIALLYQARTLHEHLKQALTELGASVVYDSPAASFDHGALSRSGARVVVVNLDPEVNDEFEQLDALLADDALRVIFNDGEVSSRLEGSDHARWARHLAAKILGVDDTNPPRPKGSEAIPVRVKSLAPDHPSSRLGDLSFELEGDALAKALAADTGEALLRTRAALVTKDEPVPAHLVDPHAKQAPAAAAATPRAEPPTLELPRVRMEDAIRLAESASARAADDDLHVPSSERPTVRLAVADLDAALAAREDDDGLSLESMLPAGDLAFDLDADAPSGPTLTLEDSLAFEADAADGDDGSLTLETLREAGDDGAITLATSALDDDGSLDEGGAVASGDRLTIAGLDDDGETLRFDGDDSDDGTGAGNDLDAALRDFGFMDEPAARRDDGDGEAALGDSLAIADEDFGSALGALNLEPFDGDDDIAPSPRQRDAAPPPSLDDMLLQMKTNRTDDDHDRSKKAAASDKATVMSPAMKAMAAAKAATPAAPATPAPAAARAPAAPAATPAAPAKARAVSDFDLSHLSLEPIADESDLSAPTTGRASFGATGAAAAASTPEPAPRTPSFSAPVDDDDFSGFTLEAIDEPADDARPAATAPSATAPAARVAPAAAAKPATPAAKAPVDEDSLAIDAFDFSLDDDLSAHVTDVAGDDAAAESDLMAELAAMSARTGGDAVAAEGPISRVWVLGASIGGPEAVREFLSAIPADAPVLFLLAQHMGADFLDLMVQQLARATSLKVRTVVSGDQVKYGEVIVVPLAERLLVDRAGDVRITASDGQSSYSPSIDQVMRDVADRFGADAGAIVFSGMAHDAIDGASYLHERGGTIWVQDPATCVISSMVDGARDAGVVSLVGSPAELARQFMLRIFRAG